MYHSDIIMFDWVSGKQRSPFQLIFSPTPTSTLSVLSIIYLGGIVQRIGLSTLASEMKYQISICQFFRAVDINYILSGHVVL